MKRHCDRRWEVDAQHEGRLGDKEVDSLERHLKACEDCRYSKTCDERLRTLGQALPDEPPSELVLKRLRARILRDVATGAKPAAPGRYAAIAVAAGVALVAAGGAWAALRSTSRPAPPSVAAAPVTSSVEAVSSAAGPGSLAGAVVAVADARWAQVRDVGLERVTLDDGTIDVRVRHQTMGERFLVALPDGELEVRGTTFQVTVSGGATSRVHVDEGLVELRLRGQAVARLGPGETWTPAAEAPPSPAPPLAVPTSSPGPPGAAAAPVAPRPSASAPTSAEATVTVDDGAAAYAGAVQLLRQGRADEAASAFQAFMLAHPRGAQVEDASFLEAVALARAGRADAAGLAAEQHVARYPGSFHRKEAAILIARAAGLRNDCARARSVLAPWPGDADALAALGTCAAR